MCSQEEAHPSVVPECRPCELTQGGLWSTHRPCWCRTFLGCVLMLTVPLCVVLWPDASAMPLDSLHTHTLPTHGVPVPRRQRRPCAQPLMSPQGHSAPFEHTQQRHGSHSSAFAVFFLLTPAEFSLASRNQSTVGPYCLPLAPPDPSANEWEAQHETGRKESEVGVFIPLSCSLQGHLR